MCTLIEKRILNALEENECSYEKMNRYFTKETLRVNICRLRKKGFKIKSVENWGYIIANIENKEETNE